MGEFRIDARALLGWEVPPIEQAYSARDCILYALGVGVGHDDPTDPHALAYVFERELRVLPTMACVLAQARDWLRESWTGIDYERIVHGEESLVVHAPLPPGGTVVGRTRIADLVDKGPGRGALIMMEKTLSEQGSGRLLSTSTTTIFARGNGGFGGHPGAPAAPYAPLRVDHTLDLATSRRMALIYRLSGDVNPLHADPATARRAGYERPIGHGLSLLGLAVHALLGWYGEGGARGLRSLSVRFAAPFLPGETLRLSLERTQERVRFEAASVERGVLLLGRGEATLA